MAVLGDLGPRGPVCPQTALLLSPASRTASEGQELTCCCRLLTEQGCRGLQPVVDHGPQHRVLESALMVADANFIYSSAEIIFRNVFKQKLQVDFK